MRRVCIYVFIFTCVAIHVAAQKKEPAHVIIIMADQLRYDVVDRWMPNVKILMDEGVTFNKAYCTSPICAPSRASFFTGLYPNRTGSLINPWEERDEAFGKVKDGTPNLYTIMEKKWDSHHVGKQHFFTNDHIDESPESATSWITQKDYAQWAKVKKVSRPGGREFKAMVPEMVTGRTTHVRSYSAPVTKRYDDGLDNFLDHYIANESIAAIKDRDKGKPLLLNAMFLAPHPPFHIPEPYFSMIPEKDVQLPDNVGKWFDLQSPLQLYNITGFLGMRYTREQWLSTWSKYLGLVRLLDDEVGRIIKALKEEGLYDDSIILFTADHGEMLGSHSLWQKMCMYEESARVPLVIKLPTGVRYARKQTDVPVSLVDVLPTVLEYNGVSVPPGLDGKSLLPLLQLEHVPSSETHTSIFIQYDGNGSLGNYQRCVVKDGYKLIVDIFKDEIFIELYDVMNDPQEKANLVFKKERKARIADMLKELQDHMKRTGDHLTLPDNLYDQFLVNYQDLILK